MRTKTVPDHDGRRNGRTDLLIRTLLPSTLSRALVRSRQLRLCGAITRTFWAERRRPHRFGIGSFGYVNNYVRVGKAVVDTLGAFDLRFASDANSTGYTRNFRQR
jgi:hypothetical protein